MKKLTLSLFLSIVGCLPFISGCAPIDEDEHSSSSSTSGTTTTSTTTSDTSTGTTSTTSSSGPSGKTVVPAHTLKDTNPPINVNAAGNQVDDDLWASYFYRFETTLEKNYNFTYQTNSGGTTIEKFTKDGYYTQTSAGTQYYERKNGNEFYVYTQAKGYLERSETTFDLRSKFISRLSNEIYPHMFEKTNYQFNSTNGVYIYEYAGTFSSTIKFQGEYLTYLKYTYSALTFEISSSFTTEINIPEAYYYVK